MKNSFLWTGRLEGLSLLLLFFVAMPLKYLAGQPEAVRWVGSIHGGLFVAYVCLALVMYSEFNWKPRTFLLCFILASLPFGTFYFEKKFLK